jgi:transcriptional/translational regulatory protein YebC/TACO1
VSGHSKWSSIKHKKGVADARRGKLFSKLSRALIVAAREGGPDPAANLALQNAIEKARSYSMPKDNIERAIARGSGADTDAQAFETVIYEGYGPGGVAVLVDAGVDEDELMLAAAEGGADDVSLDGSSYQVIAGPENLTSVREAIEAAGIEVQSAELTMVPKTTIELEDEAAAKKVLRLIDALEESDDVQDVYANFDIPERVLEAVASYEGSAERRSSQGCDDRSEARTQGVPVSVDTGATEDAVLGASSAALRLSRRFVRPSLARYDQLRAWWARSTIVSIRWQLVPLTLPRRALSRFWLPFSVFGPVDDSSVKVSFPDWPWKTLLAAEPADTLSLPSDPNTVTPAAIGISTSSWPVPR